MNIEEMLHTMGQNQSAHLQEERDSTDLDSVSFSLRFKRKMNRVFREQAGAKNSIPHPEADTLYERIRSRIVRFFLTAAHRLKKKRRK